MATLIDISKLERNEATVPFHVAAGISIWDDPQALSENEALLSSIHTARPETDIQDITAGRNFLASLEPEQSQSIQRQANSMFGIARLLTEGSSELLPGRDWKPETVEIEPAVYRETYYKNPKMSYNDLKSQVIADVKGSRVRQFQRETSNEIGTRVDGLVGDARGATALHAMGIGSGVIAGAFVAISVAAPAVLALGVGLGAFTLFTAMGIGVTRGKVLKEIRIPFFS